MHPAAHISSASLAEQICEDIEKKRIKLPTLPEVALQVREAIESDNAGADTVARVIAKDPALSARLLQVANSPLYPGSHNIDSLVHAVARLGVRLVRTLVTTLVMKQVFQTTSPVLQRQFRAIWDDGLQVAAISRVLADNVRHLENDQAMLGGLIHNIGALPILTRVNDCYGPDIDGTVVAQLIEEIGPTVGDQILRHWHFVAALANIPTACQDLAYDPGPTATYADIVLVARLQHLCCKGTRNHLTDWSRVPAFAKIGIETEEIVLSTEEPSGQISQVRQLLEG